MLPAFSDHFTSNSILGAVATDILGVSGRLMIQAMINGQEDPAALAGLARGKLKKKATALERALEGSITEHRRFQHDVNNAFPPGGMPDAANGTNNFRNATCNHLS